MWYLGSPRLILELLCYAKELCAPTHGEGENWAHLFIFERVGDTAKCRDSH